MPPLDPDVPGAASDSPTAEPTDIPAPGSCCEGRGEPIDDPACDPSEHADRTEVETTRYCLDCREDTEFLFTYAEGYLIRAECKRCGKVERDRKLLAKVFVEDLIDRAFDAMKRQTKKAIHEPTQAVGELPKKMIQKSLREVHRILNIFKE
jgi:hypothetical protein